ncbi:ribonuclease H2, subunit B [Hyaloraphidium curvatum]|nr:ribonuclease H2, subunit B [Hyaloraphidium curvatum]
MTVWILPTPADGAEDLRLYRVPDPRTRGHMTVASSASSGSLYELQRMQDELGSWFVGDSVQSDGSALVLSDLDPLFVIVGLLLSRSESSDRFVSLDDILHPDDGQQEGLECLGFVHDLDTRLKAVCDHRDVPGYGTVFRLNRKRTVAWLEAKVEAILRELDSSGVGGSARRGPESTVAPASRARDAIAILSAYIDEGLEKELTDRYKSREPEEVYAYVEPADIRVVKRTAEPLDPENSREAKKQAQAKARSGTTAGVKALAKASTKGMNKLESFFSKK